MNLQEQEINIIVYKKLKVARNSLYAAFVIVTLKAVASYLSGSLAVLSELFHSATDLLACVATLVSINISAKPPDRQHQYGHQKIESLSALFQVLILILMCGYLIYEAIMRIIEHKPVQIDIFTFSVIIICIGIDFSRSRTLRKIARETNSQALEADSLHFSSDILSSIVVLISMLLTYFNVSRLADPVSAVLVSLVIIYTTVNLSRRAFDSLMDKVPDGIYEKIKSSVYEIKGVENIKNLRVRNSGSTTFVDMTIEVPRTKSFSEVHDVMTAVERRIKSNLPDSDIVVHSEPVESKNETINDKIQMIVKESGFTCHDVYTHKINDSIFAELHIDLPEFTDLKTAHDVIDILEKQIKEKIPFITDVKIHIDEPEGITFETEDVTKNYPSLVNAIKTILDNEQNVIRYDDLKVISANGKIRISLICYFEKDSSMETVHDIVTLLENKIYLHLKEKYPDLTYVIIHAEPSE
ncbi:MAG: cation diffusion facilitator family transporter [Ignavibacteria bacterium]